ncbi:DUF742 domain-containing protein [Knoellia koreensis]|jgi:hypothetical protein|uniref:DUF742 domain-containing protein n=1 Tax=Knoellia koreensis TaxID=2730921 RepID=A0A849HJU8_9MICO|nr:DUF742 domain-containing protein [Knoellia sp. DB2414S]NNM47698.1 DUF742 domain-containing protein [Knoellia sp. DB2414S]
MATEEREEAAAPRLVRPYALTSGRTESAVDLPIEATLEVQPSAKTATWPEGDLSGRIIELCAASQSVAEVSAKLHIPLGVARVLLGDLISAGHLKTRATISENTTTDERRDLIERTLSGLRAL